MAGRGRWHWALAFCYCLASRFAVAQTTGDLHGIVMDASSLPIPGALVEVSSSVLIRPRQTSSDFEGRFQFLYLPPGVYTVLARLTGFQDAVQPEVRVSLGETITVSLKLPLTVSTSVTVSDETPLIDTVGTKFGISATEQILNGLPLGRNFASVASTVGGVGSDSFGPTFFGASSPENSFLIEGVNVTGIKSGGQGKFLPLEFVPEVEVRSGGYEAEFGRSLGGNINVLTKAGGGEFHGNLFGYYDSGSLASGDAHEADRDAIQTDRLEVPRLFDGGLSLGGSLVSGRLWFFGAYDRAQNDENYLGVDSITFTPAGVVSKFRNGTDRTSTDLFAVTLTWAPLVGHLFEVSVFGDPASYRGRATTTSGSAGRILRLEPGPESATVIDRKTGGTNASARWTGFFGGLVVQAQYGYHEEKKRESSNFADRIAIRENRSGLTQLAPDSGPVRLTDEVYRRSIYRANGTLPLGDHQLKGGIEFENENPNRTTGFGGGDYLIRRLRDDGSFRFATHFYYIRFPLNCTVRTDGSVGNFGLVDQTTCSACEPVPKTRIDFRAKSLSFFLQDSFRVLPNLTINAGIRYESEKQFDASGNVALNLTDQWSPRLSVVWDPAGKARSKVFASFGRYYEVVPQEIQNNEFGAAARNFTPDRLDPIDTVIGFAPIVYGAPYIPEGLKGSYQDEVAVGGELQLGSSWAFGVRGVYRALGRALEDRCDVYDPRAGIFDLVPFPSNLTGCAIVNPGEGGSIGELRDPSNPDCFEDFPANTKPRPCDTVKVRRYYRGFEISVQHRPTKSFYLLASYVCSRLNGNYEGLVTSGFGDGGLQASPNINSDFDYIDVLPNDTGRLLNDRTHQLKLSGYYSFPFGLRAGVIASFQSGQPLSLYGVADNGYHRFLIPRGSYGEFPSTYSVDLHLQHDLTFGKFSIIPVLDVFNVTNVQRATSRNQVYNTDDTAGNDQPPFMTPTNPLFGKDIAWQAPRRMRLGLKVVF